MLQSYAVIVIDSIIVAYLQLYVLFDEIQIPNVLVYYTVMG